MNSDKLRELARDLTKTYPRSPREMLGGYVILARCVDKCRSSLAGTNGEYHFWPCSLCEQLEAFTGVEHGDLKDFIATGAVDEEIAAWYQAQSKVKDKVEIIRWNNKLRDMRPSEMSDEGQAYLETYIPKYLPIHPPVYVWFDLFDIEEGRIK
ncbi:MAG: DUF5069 domain-containing protein [bacterium]|nr:DUF5069 domain-containing protein [bacterium]